jgi:hypothetical protein
MMAAATTSGPSTATFAQGSCGSSRIAAKLIVTDVPRAIPPLPTTT